MTIDKIDISKVKQGSDLDFLIQRLNCTTNYYENDPPKSIMHFGQLCEHDDGYLCEHRLQFIINSLVKSSLIE